MTQYLVAIHHPNYVAPIAEDAETARDIDDLNAEMQRAGAIVFVGGLEPVTAARSIVVKAGRPVVSDGPYLETKEHIGGFWVLNCETLDDALEWGRKAAIACRAPVEVRPFHWGPDR